MRDVMSIDPGDGIAKVVKMRYYDEVAKNADVPDPYYGGPQGFQDVFDIIDRSSEELLDSLVTAYGIN